MDNEHFNPNTIPGRLVDDINAGDCVLFVGAGLSRASGLPNWEGLLEQALKWCPNNDVILNTEEEKEIRKFIKNGELLIAADVIFYKMGKLKFMNFMLGVFRQSDLYPNPSHRLLPKIPFAAVLTTNYDNLLETQYAKVFPSTPPTYDQSRIYEAANCYRLGEFYILKLHGDIDHIDNIVLGGADYRKLMFDKPYRSFMETLFSTKTVLFIGFSLNDPDLNLLFDVFSILFKEYAKIHYALVNEEEAGQIRRQWFDRNYQIRIIPYDARDNHKQVAEFLTVLQQKCRDPQLNEIIRPDLLVRYHKDCETGRYDEAHHLLFFREEVVYERLVYAGEWKLLVDL